MFLFYQHGDTQGRVLDRQEGIFSDASDAKCEIEFSLQSEHD